MQSVLVILFVVAVSMDGLVVGMALGVGQVKVPFSALGIISVTSFLLVFPSLILGDYLGAILPPHIGAFVGGIILIVLGLFFLLKTGGNTCWQASPSFRVHFPPSKSGFWSWVSPRRLLYLIKNPLRADLDSSGYLSYGEALLLGFALAADAFGAGLGVALSGFPIFFVSAAVGLGKFLFVWSGYFLGAVLGHQLRSKFFSYLPGIFLVALGFLNILGV